MTNKKMKWKYTRRTVKIPKGEYKDCEVHRHYFGEKKFAPEEELTLKDGIRICKKCERITKSKSTLPRQPKFGSIQSAMRL